MVIHDLHSSLVPKRSECLQIEMLGRLRLQVAIARFGWVAKALPKIMSRVEPRKVQ
jgi:hypothetical protein